MLPFFKRLIRLPYFPIIIAPVLLFSGALFSGRVLFWGLPELQFIPWREYAWQSLQHGILPLWNPFNGMGAPLIANYQLAFFYPPGWLVYVFAAIGGTQFMAWAHSLLVVLHLIWAGVGMVFFARSLGLGELAQTVSGLAFSLSGYLVARNSFFSIIWAVAWLPWIMYAVNEVVRGEKLKFSLKLLFFIAMQLLAGHAQLTWYSLLLAGLWMVIHSWVSSGFKRAAGAGLIFGLTLLVGVCLTAVQLFPTAEFLLQSQRSSAVDFELGLTYSFWPWRLLNFLSPDFFGNPGSGNYFGYAAYWEDAVYFGLIPLIFSLSTLRFLRQKTGDLDRSQKSTVRVLWILIIVAFIFALGKNTPVFPWLYQYVPSFGLFNAPARWMIWVVFCLCVLTGIGADNWKAPFGKGLRRYKTGLVITIAIAVGAGVTYLALQEVRLTFIQATAAAGFWGAIFCLAGIKMPKSEDGRKKWATILVGLVAVDLISAQWSLVPTAPTDLFEPSGQSTSLPADQRVYLSYLDEYNLKFQRFFRIEDFNPLENWTNIWKVMLPNTNLSARRSYINNFDPLLPDRYARLVETLNQLSPEERIGWLKLMNVGMVESIDPRVADGVTFTPIQASGRFQWVDCARFAKSENDAWDMTRKLVTDQQPGFVVIEGAESSPPCTSAGNNGAVQVRETNELRIDIDLNVSSNQIGAGGWLVIADTWYPGWTATVDGKETPTYRADYVFRAVQVGGGQHVLTIEFKPASFYIGAAVSIASWIIILMIILISRIYFSGRYKL